MLVVLVLCSPLVRGGIPCLGEGGGSLASSPLGSPLGIDVSTKVIEFLDKSRVVL